MRTRQEVLADLKALDEISVLIIGGGVNGIGTFRDLAFQGLDVLLVEKADFCSGASAASSHMAHGGVRYLENGEFRLVREAVQERNRLIRNAPHYVQPLATTIPIFKMFSGLLNAPLKFLGLLDRPAERGALVIKIGLMLYDAYTRSQEDLPPGEAIRPHEFDSRQESLVQTPQLNPAVRFTATYTDGAILQPERLCIEMLQDACTANPQARAVNYMSLHGFENGSVLLQDEAGGGSYALRPKVVINAAGPWIDFANRALGEPTRFIGGTKGSHLVLDHPELRAAIGDREFFFENKDGRIVLIFPLLDKVLVGTSDLPIDDPEAARCTDEEVEYFLGMIDRVFPGIRVSPGQIIFRFSGVRPLPAADAARPGQISRDHSIRVLEADTDRPFPVYSLIGGKWTTFRAFSEQAADTALRALGLPRRTSTRTLPIGGGRDFPRAQDEQDDWLASRQAETGVSPQRMRALFDRYGTYAARIAAFIAAGEDRVLQHHPAFSWREVGWLLRQEAVVHLDDLLLRRSLLAMLGEVDAGLLAEIADAGVEYLGWTAAEREREVQHTLALLSDRHGVRLKG
jgi:glycerol-3-phosphate dehydrogenase